MLSSVGRRVYNERLCLQCVRDVRLVDAELRLDTNHNYRVYAHDILKRYDELGEINGASMLEERMTFYQQKYGWITGIHKRVGEEAGVDSEELAVISTSLQRFEEVVSYLEDIMDYVEADTLEEARKKKHLLYMQT